MTEDLRWSERDPLPDDVRAAMREVLAEALREAARTEDPGDGSMILLGAEKILGKGMWDGGWKLQASFVEDVRMNARPFVSVHAYQDSQVSKGSVEADVVRTPEDMRFLARQRLDAMVRQRDAMNVAIEKLANETEGDETMDRDTVVEACARAAHEVNRAYCVALGDASQPSWEDAPDWQKSSARNGVAGALSGNTPEQSHESWLAEKRATGWKYGLVKDPEKKEHPCFVPYADLPPEQQAKDHLFTRTVREVARALGM